MVTAGDTAIFAGLVSTEINLKKEVGTMTEYDLGRASLIQMIKAAHSLFDVGSIGLLRMAGEDVAENPLSLEEVEGATSEVRDGIFALSECPFAGTIATFKDCCGPLPEEMFLLADYANKQGEAWVSAFCGIHQSFRRAKIGDSYQQIGCRGGDKVIIADQDILSEDEARSILEKNACVFAK